MRAQIFLTGPGRSGTTLANYMLSLHPEVTSINSWYAVTKSPVFNYLGERIRSVAFLRERFGKKKGFPRANEPLKLWKQAFHNFWDAVNLHEDLDVKEKENFRRQIADIMKYDAAHKCFMTKITGPPFNHVLKDIFPKSKVVWVDRDPRAVVLSYIKKGWVGVERISKEEVSSMSRKDLIRHSCERYLHYYNLRTKENFDYILYYERLVDDPAGEIYNLLNALELSKDADYFDLIEAIPIYENRNSDYDLDSEENDLMMNLLAVPLKARGLI